MFVAHPAQRWFWTGALPRGRRRDHLSRGSSCRSRSRAGTTCTCSSVVPEASGVVSIYLAGDDLDLLKARGGQFFQWRFMTRDWWWQAHPYSLSASPNSVVAAHHRQEPRRPVGDAASAPRRAPGCWAEGPYGVFTAAARARRAGDRVRRRASASPRCAPCSTTCPSATDVDDRLPVLRGGDRAAARRARRARRRARLAHPLPRGPAHPAPASPPALILGSRPASPSSDVFVCGPTTFTDAVVDGVAQGRRPRRTDPP